MDAPPVQYVKTRDGYDIAYCVCGEGTPLVYLPNPFNHVQLYWRTPGVFRTLYERLAARFRLVCYDSRGLGSSTRGLGESHSSRDFEVDLETMVDHLKLSRFVLLAQHNFGRIAMSYAARRPERVLGLVLWNADLGEVEADSSFKPTQLESLASANWDLFVESVARSAWLGESPGVANRLIRESITQTDWLTRSRAWRQYSAENALHNLTMPVLIMAHAAGAFVSTEETSRYMASQIPGARLAIFEDDGGGLFSQAAEVRPPGFTLLEEFVSGLEPDAGARKGPSPAPGIGGLSGREVEVLRLLAAGRSNQQIADALVISLNTVNRHVSNVYAKTGAANRAEAAVYAARHGIA